MENETNYETMKAQKKSMETTCGAKKHQERNEKIEADSSSNLNSFYVFLSVLSFLCFCLSFFFPSQIFGRESYAEGYGFCQNYCTIELQAWPDICI